MAIIRSLAIGKGRKSAGNITFRTVRGRTIVSEKRGGNPTTRGDGLSVYEATFKMISTFLGAHRADINVSFDKSKFGSQGNNFYKINKAALTAAVEPLIAEIDTVTITKINEAIATYATKNPTAIYRVKRTGYPTKYMTGPWSSADNPVQPIPAHVSSVSIDGTVLEEGFENTNVTAGTPITISGTNLADAVVSIYIGGDYKTTDSTIISEAKELTTVLAVTSKTNTRISGTLIAQVRMGAFGVVSNSQILYKCLSMNPLG